MHSTFRYMDNVVKYAEENKWGLYQDFPMKDGDAIRKVDYITQAGCILQFLSDGHGEVIKITAPNETVWGQ